MQILISVADPPSARHYFEKSATPDENLQPGKSMNLRASPPLTHMADCRINKT
jgi:hypothetical protein